MRLKLRVLFLALFIYLGAQAQRKYTTADVHSHNDYENKIPFWTAYKEGYGSIEADIFLVGDQLYVGHDTVEIKMKKTLQKFYLNPIRLMILKNHGSVYKDKNRKLQILVDVKTDSSATLNRLVKILKGYPSLIQNKYLRFVISGNRPDPKNYPQYPNFIWFDGRLNETYSPLALKKVGLISDDFSNFSNWEGKNSINPGDEKKLEDLVHKAHALHKKLRFWATPDTHLTWNEMMKLKVDYINTDSIVSLSHYLKVHPQYH